MADKHSDNFDAGVISPAKIYAQSRRLGSFLRYKVPPLHTMAWNQRYAVTLGLPEVCFFHPTVNIVSVIMAMIFDAGNTRTALNVSVSLRWRYKLLGALLV
jgi:hypothetical protein